MGRNQQWDRSGTIVETGQFRQYFVKLDGSGRITLRNCRHIRKILVEPPVTPVVDNRPTNTQTVILNNQDQIYYNDTNSNQDIPPLHHFNTEEKGGCRTE